MGNKVKLQISESISLILATVSPLFVWGLWMLVVTNWEAILSVVSRKVLIPVLYAAVPVILFWEIFIVSKAMKKTGSKLLWISPILFIAISYVCLQILWHTIETVSTAG